MASPQLEDGYTRISNEILEALARIRISGEEWQVFCVILRKTWGWNKKMDVISISQFTQATGLGRGGVSRALNKLLQKRAILKKETLIGVTYGVQTDYRKWVPVPKKERGSNIGSKGSSKLRDTKETLTKETSFVATSDELRLALLLDSLIRKRNPKQKRLSLPNEQTWAEHINKLSRIDGHTSAEIEGIIKSCQSDEFWQNNILSTAKLRKHYDQLTLKLGNHSQGDMNF
jgi:phage replication O-like protein O